MGIAVAGIAIGPVGPEESVSNGGFVVRFPLGRFNGGARVIMIMMGSRRSDGMRLIRNVVGERGHDRWASIRLQRREKGERTREGEEGEEEEEEEEVRLRQRERGRMCDVRSAWRELTAAGLVEPDRRR